MFSYTVCYKGMLFYRLSGKSGNSVRSAPFQTIFELLGLNTSYLYCNSLGRTQKPNNRRINTPLNNSSGRPAVQ